MTFYVASPIIPLNEESLMDYVGSGRAVAFKSPAPPKYGLFHIYITLPAGIRVPSAVTEEKLIVTFTCTEGRLDRGNIASAVHRP
jgi:hypothetical protein